MTRHDTEHPYELISAFADGEATPAERDFVESHLKACAECCTLLEDLRQLSSAVAGEEAPPVPADLAARIRWRLKSAGSSSERPPRRRAWLSPIPMSTAAGLLVAVAVVWVLRGENRMSSIEERPPSPVLDQKVSESPMPQESLKKKRMKEISEQGLLALVPQDAPDDTLVLDGHVLELQIAPEDTLAVAERALILQDAPEDILLLDGHVAKVFVRSGDGELNQAAEHILSVPEPPPGRQSTLRKI
ncbi:MAG: zf-HC2 domain-containing protein, partial [Acidobacteria bacterium]|nr:zf-HC2 domain-containing protein [Acidobacteriota bacterium]